MRHQRHALVDHRIAAGRVPRWSPRSNAHLTRCSRSAGAEVLVRATCATPLRPGDGHAVGVYAVCDGEGNVDVTQMARLFAACRLPHERASHCAQVACGVAVASAVSLELGCPAARCLEAVRAGYLRARLQDDLRANAFAMPKSTARMLLALPAGGGVPGRGCSARIRWACCSARHRGAPCCAWARFVMWADCCGCSACLPRTGSPVAGFWAWCAAICAALASYLHMVGNERIAARRLRELDGLARSQIAAGGARQCLAAAIARGMPGLGAVSYVAVATA